MHGSRALLATSLAIVAGISLWALLNPAGALETSDRLVAQTFRSRGWFIMLSVSGALIFCLYLALSRHGDIRLGADDDRPDFSTPAWIAMLFSAGMGVGLLFYAVAEPLSHFAFARAALPEPLAARQALQATIFNWGLHAWAIYGSMALVIAYFAYRRGTPMLVSAPLTFLFPQERWARVVGWLSDLSAIAAIAIGVGGSIAMGVFQVADGIDVLRGGDGAPGWIAAMVFVAIVAAYTPALLVDLGAGMSRLSNAAMGIAVALVLYTIVLGPTQFLLNAVLNAFGQYARDVIPRGFSTPTFFDDAVAKWFNDWTLTYMTWWIAWGPFVGVFVARISRGRTIREFVLGVFLAPTLFSILWFGAFGGIGLFDALRSDGTLSVVAAGNLERVTFALLSELPLTVPTTLATIAAAFLFIVTSVVSAAFVLGTFSTGGDPEPPARLRLIWGLLLGALGAVMILSGSVDAVRSLIALGALPFIFIMAILLVCLARAVFEEADDADR